MIVKNMYIQGAAASPAAMIPVAMDHAMSFFYKFKSNGPNKHCTTSKDISLIFSVSYVHI